MVRQHMLEHELQILHYKCGKMYANLEYTYFLLRIILMQWHTLMEVRHLSVQLMLGKLRLM